MQKVFNVTINEDIHDILRTMAFKNKKPIRRELDSVLRAALNMDEFTEDEGYLPVKYNKAALEDLKE